MFGHHDSALVMMVTTFKEVKKGEEIVASYAPGMMPLSERDFMLSHSGEFFFNLSTLSLH